MVSKRDRATARRRNRQRKEQQREVTRTPDLTFGAPLTVVADYSPARSGGGWVARVTPEGMDSAQAEGQDAHETFHEVLDMVEVLADSGAAVMTIHQVNGSTDAWTQLVLREGFLACVIGDSGPHHGVTMT